MGSVAELLAMDRTTLTAALKPLERRGLVKITTDPVDRRSRRLTLTPPGMDHLSRAVPLWQKTHAILDGLLVDGGSAALRQGLQAVSAAGKEGAPTAIL